MCNEALRKTIWINFSNGVLHLFQDIMFEYVPDNLKTQDMCEEVLSLDSDLVKFVPDWFVTAGMLEKCKDDRWLEAYKQRKAEKAKIKEELLPVAWHPDRVIDWCFSEDEKEVLEKLWKV